MILSTNQARTVCFTLAAYLLLWSASADRHHHAVRQLQRQNATDGLPSPTENIGVGQTNRPNLPQGNGQQGGGLKGGIDDRPLLNFTDGESSSPPSDGKARKVMFGTRNGYDTGGTEPLCWRSSFSTENLVFNETNHIEKINNQLFELADEAKLLPSCPEQATFTARALDLEEGQGLLMDRPYTFELRVTVDVTTINERIDVSALNGVTQVHFRLHMCDAVEQGFCNPIRDTRDLDSALKREDADVIEDESGESGALPFSDDNNKWAYNTNTTLIGLMEHENRDSFFGRWCKWKLKQIEGSNLFEAAANITIQIPETPGTPFGRRPYFVVGQAVLDFPVGRSVLRLDISQAIEERVAYVVPQPEIAMISVSAKIGLGIAVFAISSFLATCLALVIINRKHKIMTMAQGNFLAFMTSAALLEAIASLTFLPISNSVCTMRGSAVLIPLTVVGAVLVGRVWRIYSTLGLISSMGQKAPKPIVERLFVKSLDVMAALSTCICSPNKQSKASFRRAVTASETAGLIAVLTLPQIALQLCGMILFTHGLQTQLTELQNEGRVVCSGDHSWIYSAGIGYASFVFLLAVMMAWFSRDLPSALNEKAQIFNAATIGTVITALSLGLAEVIDQPTTTPDATMILNAAVSLGIAFSVVYLIVFPKVQRVVSGEVVVLSHMLGSRYSMKDSLTSSSTYDQEQAYRTPAQQPPSLRERRRVQVKREDPIPPHIETKLYQVQGLLRTMVNLSGDGKALSCDDWCRMRSEVTDLKENLDLVDVSGNSKAPSSTSERLDI